MQHALLYSLRKCDLIVLCNNYGKTVQYEDTIVRNLFIWLCKLPGTMSKSCTIINQFCLCVYKHQLVSIIVVIRVIHTLKLCIHNSPRSFFSLPITSTSLFLSLSTTSRPFLVPTDNLG